MMELIHFEKELKDLQQSKDMLLIYFGGPACGVCHDMEPKLDRMLQNYPNIHAVKIEPESLPAIAATYQVFSIPVLILFVEGKETLREAGIISLNALEPKIARYYNLFYE